MAIKKMKWFQSSLFINVLKHGSKEMLLMLPLSKLQQKLGIVSPRKYMLVQKGEVYHRHSSPIFYPLCKGIKSSYPFFSKSYQQK
jgi:hypothetical protein